MKQPRTKSLNPVGAEHPSGRPSASTAPPEISRRRALILASALALVVFGVYARSLDFQFILDDHRFTSDPRIQEGGHIWDYFSNFVWAQFVGGPPSFYRPVFLLWVRTNFIVAALSSWGWHFLSIGKHVVAAALVGLVGWRLLGDWQAAFAAALLFALHPAQTESVSWVTVPDPLMTGALLSALVFHLPSLSPVIPERARRAKKARKKSATRISGNPLLSKIAAGMYFAALLSKETAIIFPAVIFSLAACREPARASNQVDKPGRMGFRARLAQGIRHTVPFLGATALYLLLRFHALRGRLGSATQHLPWRTVVLSWPAILWFYVKAMLWPVRSYAFADPSVVRTFSVRGVLLPLLAFSSFTAVVLAASFWAWRRAQAESRADRRDGIRASLITGTLLLFLPLILTLNLNSLNPGDFLHGRYTYLPLAGLMLLIAAWSTVSGKIRVMLPAAGAVLAVAFALLTLSQQRQWKDDATVFSTAHQLAPHNAPVARNLADTSVEQALALEDQGRCSEAIPMFNRVIRDYPDDWSAWAGLGVCYARLNEFPEAEESLRRAAEISHNSRVIQQWQELRAHMGLSHSASID